MAEQFIRAKEGYRFRFHGMKTNSSPDRMPPDKFPLALNIRAYTENSVRTRPGQTQKFLTAGKTITDMRGYAALFTDGAPRILARDATDRIYLDTGALVGTLANAGFPPPGVSMIPFRPSESPQPYMYIGSLTDYQKFSAPTSLNAVTQQKVGIAEPQSPPEAGILSYAFHPIDFQGGFQIAAPSPAGTAGAVTVGARTTDTVQGIFFDTSNGEMVTVQVSSATQYQRFQTIILPGPIAPSHLPVALMVQDVFAPLPSSPALSINSIFYFTGSTGRCVVVPAGLGGGPGNEGTSIYSESLLTNLRRGALVKIGTEVCLVLSVTTGPDGTVSFETVTTATHTTADALSGVPAIQIPATFERVVGVGISSPDWLSAVTAGIGTIQGTFLSSPFVSGAFSFQPEDYLHISLNIDNLANLTEIRFRIDVSDNTYTKNYYYFSIRPNDIQLALAATTPASQLSVAQTLIQNAEIDALKAQAANNQQATNSGAQTVTGSSQWSEILFPLSAMTRVGNDETLTLQNANSWQVWVNASGTVNLAFNSLTVFGGSQPDVGDIGAPLLYRVRPRAASTGVRGNPSPATRYGTNPRRQSVLVTPPSAAYDPQIDTWDVFRYGGTITSWRYVGSIPVSAGTFTDNFNDDAVNAGDALDFDNFEPWPSVDIPNMGTATQVCGTIAVVSNADLDITSYLPGTLVQLGGQNVYTLRKRPVAILAGATYLLEFEENAGAAANISYLIQEPSIANQHLPYLFGPDSAGTVFGCGDRFRPGTLSFTKNYAPDSAPDAYNLEITSPTEPLLGGEVLDGLAFVASTERWWALYPQPQNPAQRYNIVQAPFLRGLAAPFAHCNDGRSIYWWAKDGIYSSSEGSLTDADLYNLFPHEGIVGQSVVRGSQTILPPDYSQAASFRLAYANGYLYAAYPTISNVIGFPNVYTVLVCHLATKAWSLDLYTPGVTSLYHPEQQAGTLLSGSTRYDELLMGTSTGIVASQTDLMNDLGGPIVAQIVTFEDNGGDTRAGEQWGDIFLDVTPAAAGAALIATPTAFGVPLTPAITIPQSTARTQLPVSVGGEVLSDFLGLALQWTDDFTAQAIPTSIHVWQPSFLVKPETIADRFSDWDDGGVEGAKWVQGFVMHADTFAAIKGIAVRDADFQLIHPFTPQIVHNGESEIAYSFNQPFIAHMMRLEPTDQLPWRFWDVRWVVQETPELAETWQTQASTFGLLGFMHIRQVSITYAATAPVTLTITAFDGTSPLPIVLPATGGAVQKLVLVPTFNKGQLYFLNASSAQPFQIYVDKSELLVGQWGRQDSYLNRPLVGDTGGDKAEI
jgi:hypothetical protein